LIGWTGGALRSPIHRAPPGPLPQKGRKENADLLPLRQGVRRPGRAEVEALRLRAAFAPEEGQVLGPLHAFGGDGHAEAFAEAEDGADDRLAVATFAEALHEGLVDLDLGEGEAAQVAQRRITRAEVVHRDADAERTQGV